MLPLSPSIVPSTQCDYADSQKADKPPHPATFPPAFRYEEARIYCSHRRRRLRPALGRPRMGVPDQASLDPASPFCNQKIGPHIRNTDEHEVSEE
jgi:hypothetical protein